MSFINITEVYTATPVSPPQIPVPKNVFRPSDPFAIVMHIQNSNDLADLNPPFNAVFQMVNPRNDPRLGRDPWWHHWGGSRTDLVDTIDHYWNNILFDGSTNFYIWLWWDTYSQAQNVLNGGTDLGVYFVRGQINIPNTDLFAYSFRDFWYKIR